MTQNDDSHQGIQTSWGAYDFLEGPHLPNDVSSSSASLVNAHENSPGGRIGLRSKEDVHGDDPSHTSKANESWKAPSAAACNVHLRDAGRFLWLACKVNAMKKCVRLVPVNHLASFSVALARGGSWRNGHVVPAHDPDHGSRGLRGYVLLTVNASRTLDRRPCYDALSEERKCDLYGKSWSPASRGVYRDDGVRLAGLLAPSPCVHPFLCRFPSPCATAPYPDGVPSAHQRMMNVASALME